MLDTLGKGIDNIKSVNLEELTSLNEVDTNINSLKKYKVQQLREVAMEQKNLSKDEVKDMKKSQLLELFE